MKRWPKLLAKTKNKTQVLKNRSDFLNICILMPGRYRLLTRDLERKEQRPHRSPHVGSFIQNMQPRTLLTASHFVVINCCIYLPLPKIQASVVHVLPVALPNRKPSKSSHFPYDPVCLLQLSFLPSPHFPYPPSHDVLQLSSPETSVVALW